MKEITFPAWFNGPKGESAIFQTAEEVPAGWTSGAEKQSIKGAKAAPAPKQPPVTKLAAAPAGAPAGDVDAEGHAFDPALHAATKSKTKAGLWRMKVGVARPAPVKLDL